MAFSTALTVFVVPAAYVLVETLRVRFAGVQGQVVHTPEPKPLAAPVD
jgi:hypothetical protein